MTKKRVEMEVDFGEIRRAVRLRLSHLGFTLVMAAKEIGVSKQGFSKRLAETEDLGWLAAVAAVPVDVLMTANAAAILAQAAPASGWLREIPRHER